MIIHVDVLLHLLSRGGDATVGLVRRFVKGDFGEANRVYFRLSLGPVAIEARFCTFAPENVKGIYVG